MKNLNKWIFIFSLLLTPQVWSVNGYIPIENQTVLLPDGRKITAEKSGPNSHRIILRLRNKILWEKNFEHEYDRLWDFTFFIPIKKNKYIFDIDKDGLPEIAIGTWDGGNNMDHRSVLIFKVKPNSLEYYATKPFNLEYGKYVYP